MPTVNKITRPWQHKEEEKKPDKFYTTKEWMGLRKHILSKNPLCYYCGLRKQLTIATIGDHFRPKKLFPEYALDPNNIHPSCHTCHQKKRQWEKGIGGKEVFEMNIDAFLSKLKA